MAKGPDSLYPATSMPDPDWWNALWPDPPGTLAALGLAAGLDLAVDLCCGDGLFTPALAALARSVVALDLDPAMLERARARLAGTPLEARCRFVAADAADLPRLLPRPAEAVLLANTFHGAPDKPGLAAAVAAALRPGGRFIVVNWHRRPREETTVLGKLRGPATELRMTPQDVAEAASAAGLRPRRVVELPPYHYGAILERA